MSDSRRSYAGRLMAHVSRVLWEVWDPIGVNNDPAVRDEYEGYVGRVASLLLRGASDEELAALLLTIETKWMGGAGSSLEHRLAVAAALRKERM